MCVEKYEKKYLYYNEEQKLYLLPISDNDQSAR